MLVGQCLCSCQAHGGRPADVEFAVNEHSGDIVESAHPIQECASGQEGGVLPIVRDEGGEHLPVARVSRWGLGC